MNVTDADARDTPMNLGRRPGALSGPRPLVRWLRAPLWVVLLVVGYLVPTLLGGSNRIFSTCVLIAIYAVMTYGLDLVLSYLGEVSLGHTLFWAAGGYVTALTSVKAGWGPGLSLLAAVVVTTVLAFVLGVATIRTREFVFSLVTYGAAFIGLTIASNSAFLGGSDGLVGIPVLTLPAFGGHYVAGTNAQLWPVAFVLLVLVILLIGRFRRSRLGATALMTQMNPALAITLGVDIRRVRVLVFVLSAPVTALAGWLYAYQRSYISPDLISPFFLLFMLTAVILPGRRLLLGPLVGAAILTTQSELFSFGGNGDKMFLGGLLAVVLLLSPDGLVGVWRWIVRGVRGRRSTATGAVGTPGGGATPGENGDADPTPRSGATASRAAALGSDPIGGTSETGGKPPRGPHVTERVAVSTRVRWRQDPAGGAQQ
jgi:branched-chain amino acid transport system permease protein